MHRVLYKKKSYCYIEVNHVFKQTTVIVVDVDFPVLPLPEESTKARRKAVEARYFVSKFPVIGRGVLRKLGS